MAEDKAENGTAVDETTAEETAAAAETNSAAVEPTAVESAAEDSAADELTTDAVGNTEPAAIEPTATVVEPAVVKHVVADGDGEGGGVKQAVEIFFYELADGRGWVHDFHPNAEPGHRAIAVLRGARALRLALGKHGADADPALAARARERMRGLATQELAAATETFERDGGEKGEGAGSGGGGTSGQRARRAGAVLRGRGRRLPCS